MHAVSLQIHAGHADIADTYSEYSKLLSALVGIPG